jgi:hypothetical protein
MTRRTAAAILLTLTTATSVLLGAACVSRHKTQAPASPSAVATASGAQPAVTPASGAAASPKDATYIVEGKSVTLTNGVSEVAAAPGSASKVTTTYLGNDATGDLNGDGQADTGFVLTQSSGGSGTFFYAAAALKTKDGYTGTNAVLLGDRIAPQSTQINNGLLIVNYADRKPGEPFTTPPSVGVTKTFRVADGKLVAQ